VGVVRAWSGGRGSRGRAQRRCCAWRGSAVLSLGGKRRRRYALRGTCSRNYDGCCCSSRGGRPEVYLLCGCFAQADGERKKKKCRSGRRSTRHAHSQTAVFRRTLAGGLMAELAEAALGFGGAPACDSPTGTPAAAPRRPQVGQGVARFVKPRRFQKP